MKPDKPEHVCEKCKTLNAQHDELVKLREENQAKRTREAFERSQRRSNLTLSIIRFVIQLSSGTTMEMGGDEYTMLTAKEVDASAADVKLAIDELATLVKQEHGLAKE